MPKCLRYYKDIEKRQDYRNRHRAKYYNKFKKPPNRWTQQEDNLVLKHEYTDAVLSTMIQHGVNAIQIRRSYLKRQERERQNDIHIET